MYTVFNHTIHSENHVNFVKLCVALCHNGKLTFPKVFLQTGLDAIGTTAGFYVRLGHLDKQYDENIKSTETVKSLMTLAQNSLFSVDVRGISFFAVVPWSVLTFLVCFQIEMAWQSSVLP